MSWNSFWQGVGDFFTGGAVTANKNNQQNLAFQKDTLSYQKDLQQQIFSRADNAIRRQVADLVAAGLNPNLAAGLGGADVGSPVGVITPQTNAASYGAGFANSMSNLASLSSTVASSLVSYRQLSDSLYNSNWYRSHGLPVGASGFASSIAMLNDLMADATGLDLLQLIGDWFKPGVPDPGDPGDPTPGGVPPADSPGSAELDAAIPGFVESFFSDIGDDVQSFADGSDGLFTWDNNFRPNGSNGPLRFNLGEAMNRLKETMAEKVIDYAGSLIRDNTPKGAGGFRPSDYVRLRAPKGTYGQHDFRTLFK